MVSFTHCGGEKRDYTFPIGNTSGNARKFSPF